jgi:hypothetical protein
VDIKHRASIPHYTLPYRTLHTLTPIAPYGAALKQQQIPPARPARSQSVASTNPTIRSPHQAASVYFKLHIYVCTVTTDFTVRETLTAQRAPSPSPDPDSPSAGAVPAWLMYVPWARPFVSAVCDISSRTGECRDPQFRGGDDRSSAVISSLIGMQCF